ncbi:PhoH family protein [Opitutaceae bacterium TAV4]|uniref:PhoH family protein n=1 Tax=Geminisphaera colitermitum TaxID=1148786 RepID=UPI000158CE5A|nr:PhoH family protein [Geminisphaera colitermitum]RRJ96008.1 PhoH family protein [Opitutaceae bacterium TAV4]RRK00155.1 PhoH family protein [Opitutaceae bacterium TAV3]
MEHLSGTSVHKPRLKFSAKVKTFVLDTNVLLHDPQSIFKFEDNNLAIPVEVLEELDAIKTEQSTERGRNARRVHRILSELLPDSRSMHEGVRLENGGTLSVIINPYLADPSLKDSPGMRALRAVLPDMGKKDNRIIAAAVFVKDAYPPPTILVTKDVNVALKARAVGLEAQDYLNDKVPLAATDDEASYRVVPVTIYELQRFCSEGFFDIGHGAATTGADVQPSGALHLNEYVLLRSDEGKTMPARHYGEGIVRRLKIPEFVKAPGGIPIRPRNLEQQFLVDALLDDSISLITCYGKAGTGKTLLSIGCALHQTHDDHSRYDGVSISRPVMALGKDIGFLPGTMEEKMKPWLQPYFDALEVLMPSKPPKDPQFAAMKTSKKKQKRHHDAALEAASAPFVSSNGNHSGQGGGGGANGNLAPMKPYERLIKSGLVEVEALCFIRGRSIARRFFILDEAQQLTPHEVKTVITRISEGSKIVLIGDPAQIDNPYVDARSNGLVYCHNRMKGQALAAHVKLTKGERSRLAELAADLL